MGRFFGRVDRQTPQERQVLRLLRLFAGGQRLFRGCLLRLYVLYRAMRQVHVPHREAAPLISAYLRGTAASGSSPFSVFLVSGG